MRVHNVPYDLQRRVMRWYDYAWSRGRTSGCTDIASLALLPDKLKTEMALHVNLDTLKKVTIFQECRPEFLHDLVLKMKPFIFTPSDLICRRGEVAREMFIISDGVLQVISETGDVIKQMGSGDFFGEIGILNLDGGVNRRTADVKSVGYSELFVLSKEDMLTALKDHPDAERLIVRYGTTRLNEIKDRKSRRLRYRGARPQSPGNQSGVTQYIHTSSAEPSNNEESDDTAVTVTVGDPSLTTGNPNSILQGHSKARTEPSTVSVFRNILDRLKQNQRTSILPTTIDVSCSHDNPSLTISQDPLGSPSATHRDQYHMIPLQSSDICINDAERRCSGSQCPRHYSLCVPPSITARPHTNYTDLPSTHRCLSSSSLNSSLVRTNSSQRNSRYDNVFQGAYPTRRATAEAQLHSGLDSTSQSSLALHDLPLKKVILKQPSDNCVTSPLDRNETVSLSEDDKHFIMNTVETVLLNRANQSLSVMSAELSRLTQLCAAQSDEIGRLSDQLQRIRSERCTQSAVTRVVEEGRGGPSLTVISAVNVTTL